MRRTTRGRITALAAAVGIAVVGLVAPATPAAAVTYYSYIGAYSRTCIQVPQTGTTVVDTVQCAIGSEKQDFALTRMGGTTAQPIYVMRNRQYGTCLDINGNLEFPAAKPCVTGSLDQRWEFFTRGSNVVIKSWGAWANRQQHRCLTNQTQFDSGWLRKATCDAANARQQWDQY